MNEKNDDKQKFLGVPSATKSQTLRHINPLGMRVVVRIPKEQNVTEGGLYLPEGAKEKMNESIVAEVVEVASAVDGDTQEETNISGIPLGASILIPRRSGVQIPWDETLRIVDTKEVLAIINNIDIT
ncbi:MAG: co-chaperone GroES family protein [Bdellovibrionota bacterium]|jgi:co-chaperonin GroES (HSP10)